MLVEERRRRILERLRAQGRVRVRELSQAFGVSEMTIHRDLQHLEAQGLLQRVFGGAVAVRPAAHGVGRPCAVCGRPPSVRTAFVVQCADGRVLHACCPHCGLLLLARHAEAVSALATDFLFGHMVNVRSAAFLYAPDLTLCCSPGVLCFADVESATRFQRGFGGQVLSWAEARDALQHHMTLCPEEEEPCDE